MRKNYLVMVLVVCLALLCALTLTACGGEGGGTADDADKCFYTVNQLPTGISSFTCVDNGYCSGSSDGRPYVDKGVGFVILNLTEGYEINTLKVAIDGADIVLTKNESNKWEYSSSYTFSADFTVTISGEAKALNFETSLAWDDSYSNGGTALSELELAEFQVKIIDNSNVFNLDGNDSNVATFTVPELRTLIKNGVSNNSTAYGAEISFEFCSTPVYKYIIAYDVIQTAAYEFQYSNYVSKGVSGIKFTVTANGELTIDESYFNHNSSLQYAVSMVDGYTEVLSFSEFNSFNGLFEVSATSGGVAVSGFTSDMFLNDAHPTLNLKCLKYSSLKSYYDAMTLMINGKEVAFSVGVGDIISIPLNAPYTYGDNIYTAQPYYSQFEIRCNLTDNLKTAGLTKEVASLYVSEFSGATTVDNIRYLVNGVSFATDTKAELGRFVVSSGSNLIEKKYVLKSETVSLAFEARELIAKVTINGNTDIVIDGSANGYRFSKAEIATGVYRYYITLPSDGTVTSVAVTLE